MGYQHNNNFTDPVPQNRVTAEAAGILKLWETMNDKLTNSALSQPSESKNVFI